jgi:hypothetical protein
MMPATLIKHQEGDMKKKGFLTSVAVLAAALAFDARAALPKSLDEQPSVKIASAVAASEIAISQTPFVLERPTASGTTGAKHSYHSSHSSHSSHRSHYSSRY